MADRGIRDGKGRILKNTDPLFTELAKNYPQNSYISFCNEFEVGFNEADQILKTQNLGNQTKALKQVLNNEWVDKEIDVTRAKLETALKNAQTAGLIRIVEKHFANYAVKEGSCEGAGNSQGDATQANIQARTGQSIAMTGTTINVTNNFGTETAEDRKRGAAEFDGPSDKKVANENTKPMTKRHRNILKKSASDLQDDLDTDDVLQLLLTDKVITDGDVAKIDSKSMRNERVATLLDILPRRSDRAYDSFLKILEKTEGSRHLYQTLKNFEGQDALEENMPIGQDAESSPDQPSRAGITSTQRDVKVDMSASGSSTVQNNTFTGQTNNVTLR